MITIFVVDKLMLGADFQFMPAKDQADWKAECCLEKNIIRGSAREHMCQSVLSSQAAERYKNRDLSANDEGLGSFVGEDEELVWTAKAKESHLGQVGFAVEGKVVNDGFLRVQPLSIEEGIDMGLWKIRKKLDNSLLQVAGSRRQSGTEDSCKMEGLKREACPAFFAKATLDKCAAKNKWQYLKKPPKCGTAPRQVPTPDQCFKHNKDTAGYFLYRESEQDPIQCYKYTEQECRGKVSPFEFAKDKDKITDVEQIVFWIPQAAGA